MTDEQLIEQFHRLDRRLERLDSKVDGLEKSLADCLSEVRTRFEGLETWSVRELGPRI